TYHRRLGSDPEKVIVEKFTYDSQNRLLTHTHQVGNNPVEYLTQNKYNEISQLESKKVGGTAAASPLQTVDYKYNIRGWMTKVNDPSNLQNKLFAYELRYNNPNSQFSGSARYNGNISQMSWITQNDAVLRNYSYEYDALNRLKEGRFWDAMNLERGEYHEQLTYDLNGNIKTLLRRGRQLPGYTAPEVMDNLEYHYENGELSNKLSYLKEIGTGNAISGYPLASGSTGSTITYDLNGNMTTQLDKGISSIQYNYLNLPGKITQNSKITDYIYRADGVKVRKVFGTETTDYLDGFQYTDSVLKFFPTAEGYFNVETGKYVYNYTDHLGNTRLSYAKSGAETEIIEESNYYPFGLKHEGYNVLTGNPAYKYKYTGKELQEMGMYDYGTRFYMPDIGRWGVHDPLSEITLQIYSYADNNPIFYNDPTGMIAQQPEMHLTIYKHKRTGEEVNINDGVNATVLVNGYDFAKAKTYAKYFDYNRASLNGNSNYEVNQGYIDFYYNTRYGNGFSFASLFDSGPDKRRMPTSDEDTMILLEMPDIGRRGPLKGALKAVEKNVVKSLVEEDAKLVKLAQEAFKGNKLLRREAEALVEQLGGGNMNPGIGSKILGKNIFEARSRGGARVYFRQGSDGIEILGYSNKHNQQKVINQIFKKNK
ncbi:RHS repeat-associated core domain-containing protein, partial [Chryseobacterium sp. ON_d1]|uniref:RHS repeat domain-containing protein n=1 Tax=Chryseobacterium sp. ON_d1 TaxID=2583211 RepID=UPI0027E4DA58